MSASLLAAIALTPVTYMLLMAGFVALIFLSLLMLLSKRYKRCPANRILVIYGKTGKGQAARCIHGGAAFVWPLIQDFDYLNLDPIQIEIPLKNALSMENIRVNVPSVFTVAIGTTEEVMFQAAVRLLGSGEQQIRKQAEDIIFGQLRQVIASMSILDINRDREKFLENIQRGLEPELRKLGLVLINVNITDINDASGYFEAIGKKAAQEAIQKARGDVADQERMGAIRVAEAEREKDIQVANANKTKEVGVRDAVKDQTVLLAGLERDQLIGEQQAKFDREVAVKRAEQSKRVATAAAEAEAVKGESEAKASVVGSLAVLKQAEAKAFASGETAKRQAEAAVVEAENMARAKAAEANAMRVEAEKRAELVAPAKAEQARVIVDAEARAEQLRLEAEGAAKATFARLEAEARGQYEMLCKKADGLRAIVDACGGADQAFRLLMLEHLDTLAETSAKAISNIKFDNVVVWDGGQQGSATANFLNGLVKSLPPMMDVIQQVAGIDLPHLKPHASNGRTAGVIIPEPPTATAEAGT